MIVRFPVEVEQRAVPLHMSVVPAKNRALKESVFHLMLQINVAPNIGQKLSSN